MRTASRTAFTTVKTEGAILPAGYHLRGRPASLLRPLAPLAMLGVLFGLAAAWLALAPATYHAAGPAVAQLTPAAFLPMVQRQHASCPGNAVTNGDFELGSTGWYTYTDGWGYKKHRLIGSLAQGFLVHTGQYGAFLGGDEGTWDVITQVITIPAQAQISYWWQLGSYETLPHHDFFRLDLLALDGTVVATLALHDDQDESGEWQQDLVDVSAYAGGPWILRLHMYNDNYYFSWIHLDDFCLRAAQRKGSMMLTDDVPEELEPD
jgi:hypothetical protein